MASHLALSFEEARARLVAGTEASERGEYGRAIERLGGDVAHHPDLYIATQARTVLAFAHWMQWEVEDAERYGMWVLRTAPARAGDDPRRELRLWTLRALTWTLSALRNEIRSSATAQLRLIAGLTDELEHRSREPLDIELRALRLQEEILALASEARLREALHLYHVLAELARTAGLRGDSQVFDSLATAEFYLHVLQARPATDRETLSEWYQRWEAARAHAELPDTWRQLGGVGDLLALWTVGREPALLGAIPRMPLAWIAATVSAAAAGGWLREELGAALAERHPADVLGRLLRHRVGSGLGDALVAWCLRPHGPRETERLQSAARCERRWPCLMI